MSDFFVIIEGIIIGLYALFLFLFIKKISDNLTIQLLILGFFKHYLGYILGLQSFYCSLYLSNNFDKYKAFSKNIIIASILEAFLFIYLGLLLNKMIHNKFILIFILGFTIHIFSDFFGIHAYFLKYNCIKESL